MRLSVNRSTTQASQYMTVLFREKHLRKVRIFIDCPASRWYQTSPSPSEQITSFRKPLHLTNCIGVLVVAISCMDLVRAQSDHYDAVIPFNHCALAHLDDRRLARLVDNNWPPIAMCRGQSPLVATHRHQLRRVATGRDASRRVHIAFVATVSPSVAIAISVLVVITDEVPFIGFFGLRPLLFLFLVTYASSSWRNIRITNRYKPLWVNSRSNA